MDDNSLNSPAIDRLPSSLLELVLLKSAYVSLSSYVSTTANDHVTFSVYVTLTSVSRAWRQLIVQQPCFHMMLRNSNKSSDDETDSAVVSRRDYSHVPVFEDELLTDEPHGSDVIDSSAGNDERDYEELVHRRTPDERLTLHVVDEIIATERTYISRLHAFNKDFKQELQLLNESKRLISDHAFNSFFVNIDSIYKLHLQLLRELQQQPLDILKCRVGAVFCKYANYFKMYSVYLNNVEHCRRLFNDLNKQPDFARLITEFEKREDLNRVSVMALMLEPVHRVPRYVLLLKEYIKRMPDMSADYFDAKRALELVECAATHANEFMHKTEKEQRLFELSQTLRAEQPLTLMEPGRTFIRDGEMNVLYLNMARQQCHRFVVLLTDLMLICDTSNNVIEQLSLRAMKVSDARSEASPFVLYLKSENITAELQFNTLQEKNDWFKDIQKAVDEFTSARRSLFRTVTALLNSVAISRDELGVMAPVWVKAESVHLCMVCGSEFTWLLRRRHHCRACGTVVCSDCSLKCFPLAFMAYRRTKVCDNCYIILEHKSRLGLQRQKTASASDPHQQLDENLLSRNNQPLGTCVMPVDNVHSVVSSFLSVSRDGYTWSARRLFVLHRDSVLYSFADVKATSASTAMLLTGFGVGSLSVDTDDGSADFCLAHNDKTPFYFRADNQHQLSSWVRELHSLVGIFPNVMSTALLERLKQLIASFAAQVLQ